MKYAYLPKTEEWIESLKFQQLWNLLISLQMNYSGDGRFCGRNLIDSVLCKVNPSHADACFTYYIKQNSSRYEEASKWGNLGKCLPMKELYSVEELEEIDSATLSFLKEESHLKHQPVNRMRVKRIRKNNPYLIDYIINKCQNDEKVKDKIKEVLLWN
jgi:hypothetical protein